MSALVRVEDYAPPDYLIETVDLDFALDREVTTVDCRMAVRRAEGVPVTAPLVLDGVGLRLLELMIDDEYVPAERYTLDSRQLIIHDAPAAFELGTRVEITPSANKSGLGLFFVEGMLASQCEAEGFRRLTFFPDRPDILARYTVRLEADRARFPVLLSNGNPVGAGDAGDGRHWARWEDPFPKPCYIFAVAAGNFAQREDRFVTKSGREVAIGLYADASLIDNCGFAIAALKRALAWDEAAFGLEYDLDTYNIVALLGWAGATENKGLNFYAASGIVADPAITTDDDFITIERIIGHEQFHNWTGNRVTCRDWFQLALKEGLTRYRDQLFMESRLGSGAWRIEMIKALRRNQFPEDDGPAAHPVQPRAYADIDNFYTGTVYEKGAELVRMLATLLGPEKFRAGFDLYIARHDGQAVTIEDFLVAMETASDHDLTQFRRWYPQAGRPRVYAKGAYDAAMRRYILTLRQVTAATPGQPDKLPFHIPVAMSLLDHSGRQMIPETLLELTKAEQSFTFDDVAAEPLPSLLRGFSAPVTVEIARDDAELALLMARDGDAFARWDAAQLLGVRTIRALAAAPAACVPETIVDVFGALLQDEATEPFLLSQLLAIPDEPILSEGLAEIPLDAHCAARTRLRRTLATLLEDPLRARYRKLSDTGPWSPDFAAIGRRKLRNACLDLLSALDSPGIADLCLRQVTDSNNMTDSFAALSVLVDLDCPERDIALAWFYNRWRNHPTVINKWFNVQALSRAPGAVDAIIALEHHPVFDVDNMDRLLAFYGGFFRQNRVAFHDPSGKGYDFLADRLLMMDAMGRAGSFWLMPQINQWRRHEPARRDLMKAALERVAERPGISAGLRETVEAALR